MSAKMALTISIMMGLVRYFQKELKFPVSSYRLLWLFSFGNSWKLSFADFRSEFSDNRWAVWWTDDAWSYEIKILRSYTPTHSHHCTYTVSISIFYFSSMNVFQTPLKNSFCTCIFLHYCRILSEGKSIILFKYDRFNQNFLAEDK